MPSWRRDEAELSPAAAYWLMCGVSPGCHGCGALDDRTWRCERDARLPRCVSAVPMPGAMAVILASAEELRAIWIAHRAALLAEAARAGFRPAASHWFETDRLPYGEGLPAEETAAWRRAFLATALNGV